MDVIKYSNTTTTVMDQAVTEQLNASNHHIYEHISQWENLLVKAKRQRICLVVLQSYLCSDSMHHTQYKYAWQLYSIKALKWPALKVYNNMCCSLRIT